MQKWCNFIGVFLIQYYHQASNISCTLVGNKIVAQLKCSWSIACRHCFNYNFILDFNGFNGLGKDNYKMRREAFKFLDWVWLIFEVWQYLSALMFQSMTSNISQVLFISLYFSNILNSEQMATISPINIHKLIFYEWNFLKFWFKFQGSLFIWIDKNTALVVVMVWCQTANKTVPN